MNLPSRRKLGVVTALIALAAAGLWAYKTVKSEQDFGEITLMTQKMKTVCVGRLLIDVPADSLVRFRPANIGGVVFSAASGSSAEKVRADIKDLQQTLTGSTNEFNLPSLEKQVEVDAVNFKTTVMYYDRTKPLTWIEHGRPVTGTDQGITVEAFGLKDDALHYFKGKDLASPKFEKNVENLVRRTASRPDETIPSDPGFCAERTLVHDPISADENEQVSVFFSLKGHPDIAIRLDTAVEDKPAEPLLARHARNDTVQDNPDRFSVLRKGERVLNGLAGEEVLVRAKELTGTTGHFFMWVSKNKVGDVMVPTITLEIETGKAKGGKRVNASLSEKALLELWDQVSATLRIRPTTPNLNTKPSAAANLVPLGEMSATGTVCPQTGYWDCSEGGNISGGRRQFFRAGEHFPHAVVHGTPTFWQKLGGEIPAHRLSTVWTLAQYELDTDRHTTAQGDRPPQGTDAHHPGVTQPLVPDDDSVPQSTGSGTT